VHPNQPLPAGKQQGFAPTKEVAGTRQLAPDQSRQHRTVSRFLDFASERDLGKQKRRTPLAGGEAPVR